jgi:hypothetical protein
MRWAGALAATAALGACGTPSTPTPSPTATPRPTPSLTPAPPDSESVSIVATGVGTWQLVTIPVAVLHDDATRHGAEEVVVHFITHGAGGQALGSLDSEAVNLVPGQTLAVAADCTDGCNGAASTAATVSVGMWTATIGPAFTATGVAYRCGTGSCGGGHGEGDVTGSLASPSVKQGAAVVAFAACFGPQGAIIGGGFDQTEWPGGAGAAFDVPVIVNRQPASCQLGASTGW